MEPLTLNAEHLVNGVPYVPVLKTNRPMLTRRFLVIHFTAGMSGASSIDYWKKPEVQASAHFVIDRDGAITQCVPCNVQAWHAGKSRWMGFENLNSCSIGIELANAGDSVKIVGEQALAFGKYPLPAGFLQAKHKNGGPIKLWEKYPEPQLKACRALAAALVKRYNLDDVVGHDDIAPDRKADPGPAFPMAEFRAALGFGVQTHAPKV